MSEFYCREDRHRRHRNRNRNRHRNKTYSLVSWLICRLICCIVLFSWNDTNEKIMTMMSSVTSQTCLCNLKVNIDEARSRLNPAVRILSLTSMLKSLLLDDVSNVTCTRTHQHIALVFQSHTVYKQIMTTNSHCGPNPIINSMEDVSMIHSCSLYVLVCCFYKLRIWLAVLRVYANYSHMTPWFATWFNTKKWKTCNEIVPTLPASPDPSDSKLQ